ncbi:unnamed protein product [Caenorhabditis auriculariae]|uniref:Uncharacterized protein n=1 Tax=Caenorhabditis auriculariae TaxID=2777116 RepID=A0A8S1H7I7_9PELO|nr:unnamed protein product [Caenorhabditis auriculariae]
MAIICKPILTFPYIAGYTTGIFTYLGISSDILIIPVLGQLGVVGIITVGLFEHRHYNSLPQDHVLKFRPSIRHLTNLLVFIYFASVGVIPFFCKLDVEPARQKIIEVWPNIPCDFWHPDLKIISDYSENQETSEILLEDPFGYGFNADFHNRYSNLLYCLHQCCFAERKSRADKRVNRGGYNKWNLGRNNDYSGSSAL